MSEERDTLDRLVAQGFSPTILNRFWRSVTKGCWIWTGHKNNKGYGMIGKAGSSTDFWLIHRVSWVIHRGPIPDGLCVLHRCDNPLCVNPDHLFLGTKKDNTQDMIAKRRNRGAARLTEDQIREIIALDRSVGYKQIAARYGITRGHVWRIRKRKRWCGIDLAGPTPTPPSV